MSGPALTLGGTTPIVFGAGAAPPTTVTRSTGTKVVLFPGVGATTFDYALGIEGAAAWSSVSNTSNRWLWYAAGGTATNVVAELTGARDFMPGVGYSGNLGFANRKWLGVWGAELNVETLVAMDTLASTNGRQLVGVSATVLTRGLAPADVHLYVKAPAFLAGDRVLFEARGKVEWVAVNSNAIDCRVVSQCPTVGNDWLYTATRNLDGSGANTFYAGGTDLQLRPDR